MSAECYEVRHHVLCKHALGIRWTFELILYSNLSIFFLKVWTFIPEYWGILQHLCISQHSCGRIKKKTKMQHQRLFSTNCILTDKEPVETPRIKKKKNFWLHFFMIKIRFLFYTSIWTVVFSLLQRHEKMTEAHSLKWRTSCIAATLKNILNTHCVCCLSGTRQPQHRQDLSFFFFFILIKNQ